MIIAESAHFPNKVQVVEIRSTGRLNPVPTAVVDGRGSETWHFETVGAVNFLMDGCMRSHVRKQTLSDLRAVVEVRDLSHFSACSIPEIAVEGHLKAKKDGTVLAFSISKVMLLLGTKYS